MSSVKAVTCGESDRFAYVRLDRILPRLREWLFAESHFRLVGVEALEQVERQLLGCIEGTLAFLRPGFDLGRIGAEEVWRCRDKLCSVHAEIQR